MRRIPTAPIASLLLGAVLATGALDDGRVLVVGGTGSQIGKTAEVYEP